MKIISARIEGFRNIENDKLILGDEITSLVSLNSYGKSNLLNAIQYSVDFIKEVPKLKTRMMSSSYGIPLNKNLALKNFIADLLFHMEMDNDTYEINYGFEFSWLKNQNNQKTGCKIEKEWLTVRSLQKHKKASRFISRENGKGLYKSSETGRCSSVIKVDDNELIVNKLASFDELFYKEIIKNLNNFNVYVERDFDAAIKYFRTPIVLKDQDNFDFSNLGDIPRVVYKLKETHPDSFEVLTDAFKQLFPNILALDVKEFDWGDIHDFKMPDDVPYVISNKEYSIYVQDVNLNQPLDFSCMSYGAKRVFLTLTYTILAKIKGYHLIALEAPENSIHPSLLQSYLSILSELSGDCRLVVSSHSPYIIQYVNTKNIYIGKPNSNGIADFSRIDSKRVKALLTDAADSSDSVGNYIFELLSGGEDDNEILLSYLEK
ncbi:MAG: AAA family ATPase [Succinivibrio sp.]|nr:AAA family ATPase [Succinivibrio sp.]